MTSGISGTPSNGGARSDPRADLLARILATVSLGLICAIFGVDIIVQGI